MTNALRTVSSLLVAGVLLLLAGCASAGGGGSGSGGSSHARGELVLVTGATGKTGRLVVAQLQQRGYRVRAMSRDVERARIALGANVEVVAADLREPATLAAAVRGVRRIVSTAGAGTLDENDPNGPRVVDYEGVRHLVEAARAAHVRQVVLISTQFATMPDAYGFAPMRPLLGWKFKGEQALRASGLDYTIVRPGQLLDGPGGVVRLRFGKGDVLRGPISRADLATVCVEALGRKAARRRTFEVAATPDAGANDFGALYGALAPD
ncbi:MAG: SDR family oxidoreductase [Steroidobacteraceae bacterium]